MSTLRPVVRESTPSLIARQLRAAIADGRFAPGQQLAEAELARELGVSRGPLREAMQRLTQEGLLVSHRNRGLFVMDLDPQAVRDIYLARTAIERAAVELLINDGGASAESLLDVVAEMRELAGAPNSTEMSEADLRFHERLVALAASPRLLRMHETLLTETRLCLTRMQGTYDDNEKRVAEHDAIARAVLAGDLEQAKTLLAAHMEDGMQRVLGETER
ncbi:GntR family transcriptional regulator [Naumannella cuiyingiana]|uniref:DNA-binding GntR family transcriptional regulator n=1 Tax=Naumannella cuiyingiana TaxID=1347891 RepID=A0A7Z0D7Q4_9ACTN|nr:GntR family transcriptional regulator [Naumannella cuiyingiana]NYI70424.1 DNA-binding GntR family transcriptional regulator [Naumannella cuiyingiana]